MLTASTNSSVLDPDRPSRSGINFRLIAAVLLLAAAVLLTWRTVDGLAARRVMRTEYAEIGHVRYSLLNADVWAAKIVPILEKKIDALDVTASDQANLRPMVQKALYRLLDQVKQKMSSPQQAPGRSGSGGLMDQANSMLVNMVVGALAPKIPEFTDVVLAELTKPENKQALKTYLKDATVKAMQDTFGNVDKQYYSSILQQNGCTEAEACRELLARRIREADSQIARYYLGALAASALAFLLLWTGAARLSRSAAIVLLLFCVTLLVGGILTPMVEVEARLTQVGMTLMGEKITFPDQVLYFQSKSVLEVFDALIRRGRADMWVVGVLVLTFSVVFPFLKILTSTLYLFKPDLLRKSRIARFFVLESSKWSMADVMALAIFMAFVAFNGLVTNTLSGLSGMGIPTDGSKILPGYYLFIGFCLASLFLAKKLTRGVEAP